MKYLVLGSNSFAGSTFVNEVLFQGEHVVGISRSDKPNAVLQPYAQNKNLKNFTFYALDLNKNFSDVKKIISEFKPNYIVDFAAQSMVAESWVYPDQWYTTNIVAKVRLHDFLRTCDFLERYIRISTPEVYGHVDGKITEAHPFNPTTPYAVSQAAIDMSLAAFYKQYKFPVIFTRYANFYGPHQQFYRIIPKAAIYGILKKKLPLHGGGVSKRAFIYGTDVATAITASIKNGKLGESYHFSTGDCISIAELIHKIADSMNVEFNDLVEMSSERPGKDFQYFMSSDKAGNELRWKPSVPLDLGIQNTIHWAIKNKEIISQLPHNYIHKP